MPVIEKAIHVMAVPTNCERSDLGAWDTLWRLADRNNYGVAISDPPHAGTKHLIEVQTGNYYSEDDSVRYEDTHNCTDMPTE